MAFFDNLDSELDKQIKLIFEEFIARYFPAKPEDVPDTYHLHVKAYCTLAHAIFEEFVEQTSVEVMNSAIKGWLDKRDITPPLLSLLLSYNAEVTIINNEEEDQPRYFDAIRTAIEQVKQEHSKAIYENNGFSLKYLRSILTPVAIDISNDPSLSSSLRTLADARGSYAHGYAELGEFTDRKKAKHPMTPEKAKEIVQDCQKLCKKISKDARRFSMN